MKRNLLTLLFITASMLTKAQVYGFMGKRHAVSINSHLSLAGSDAPTNPQSTRSGMGINKKFSIGYDFASSNKWVIGTEVMHYSTATTLDVDDNFIDKKNSIYGVTANGFAITFSRFGSKRNPFIAPVGRYFAFGIRCLFYKATDDNAVLSAPNTVIHKGTVVGLYTGIGRKRIIKKTIVLDFGGGFLIPLNSANDPAASRIRSAWGLGLKLGVGYLL